MKKVKSRRKKELIMAVILVTAVFVLMWMIRPWEPRPTFDSVKSSVGQAQQVRRALDGVLVEKGKENPPLAGVMIENMIEAQPLSGIADARLVFEAVAEANITRFLGYFVLDDNNIEIGPVRSARPYYLDFAAEFNALYGHVGSSPAAYELLRKKGVDGVHDFDQWYNSQYFFEKPGRPRPHHLYTSGWLLGQGYANMLTPTPPSHPPEPPLGQGGKDHGRGGNETMSPPFEGGARGGLAIWQFKNDASPDLRGDVREILIGYTPPYNVQWQYDAQANQYGRAQWARPTSTSGSSVVQGGEHRDANGKAITAKNIAVAFMEMKVLDEVGRKEFTTIGQGKGLVFQDGRVVVGTWKKPAARERIRFYDGQGNEAKFNAGVTWVEIVPKGYEVKF